MTGDRREKIMDVLKNSSKPIKGGELAEALKASRQAIVQDIALLRAQGAENIATPQGYFVPKLQQEKGITKVLACQHEYTGMAKELEIIISYGGKVLDVIVEHPVYGELKGNLMLETKEDIQNFQRNIAQSGAEPLASLTKGVHLHTIVAPSTHVLDKIEQELKEAGLLL